MVEAHRESSAFRVMRTAGRANTVGAMTRAKALLLADAVVIATLAGSALWQVLSWTGGEVPGGRSVHAVLVVATTVPLLFRRRHAAFVLLVVLASAWIQFELGGGLGQPFFAVLLALYSIGAHAPAPQTFLGPAVIGLQVVAIDVPRLLQDDPVDEVVPAWFVLAGVWAFGRWMRRRHVESAKLVERADAAERQAAEQAARAVVDERARIARELHDLVAHSMGVIVIQAQGAQRAMDTNLDLTRNALSAIESTGRSALAEMRRLLGLLTARTGADCEVSGDTLRSTAPQPGMAQLAALADQVRGAGLPVELSVKGDVRPLPAGLELSGYRVVQEALTNALKHAGPASARVQVTYGPDRLDIDVADTGGGPRGGGPMGHGLVGMRERVLLYGGSLEAGAASGGGFAIHAQFPLNGEWS